MWCRGIDSTNTVKTIQGIWPVFLTCSRHPSDAWPVVLFQSKTTENESRSVSNGVEPWLASSLISKAGKYKDGSSLQTFLTSVLVAYGLHYFLTSIHHLLQKASIPSYSMTHCYFFLWEHAALQPYEYSSSFYKKKNFRPDLTCARSFYCYRSPRSHCSTPRGNSPSRGNGSSRFLLGPRRSGLPIILIV